MSNNKHIVLVYATCETYKQAEKIAQTCVEEQLAACANILGQINSVFRWQGKIEQAREQALILKTRQQLVDKLSKRITELHTYDVPCVVAIPITGGSEQFIDWVKQSCKEK